ncbi:MAG TPA: DUF5655 domain-containing protein [bacterium]|nr:DUF5655 domain-containing protein [bacterium]
MPKSSKAAAVTNPYSPHPSIQMMINWVHGLKKKTGRSLDEWMAFIEQGGPPTEEQRREWLKAHHKLGTNESWYLAELSVGKGWDDLSPEAYVAKAPQMVEAMFEGKRAHLRPVYDALLELGLSQGPDVKACPCKTIVPLYRTHVFAEIKPATNSRIDLGFALGDMPAEGRLIDTGGFARKDRITHRIPITTAGEIDAEVKKWLKTAYTRAKKK